jgi:hypothetical protein
VFDNVTNGVKAWLVGLSPQPSTTPLGQKIGCSQYVG